MSCNKKVPTICKIPFSAHFAAAACSLLSIVIMQNIFKAVGIRLLNYSFPADYLSLCFADLIVSQSTFLLFLSCESYFDQHYIIILEIFYYNIEREIWCLKSDCLRAICIVEPSTWNSPYTYLFLTRCLVSKNIYPCSRSVLLSFSSFLFPSPIGILYCFVVCTYT